VKLFVLLTIFFINLDLISINLIRKSKHKEFLTLFLNVEKKLLTSKIFLELNKVANYFKKSAFELIIIAKLKKNT